MVKINKNKKKLQLFLGTVNRIKKNTEHDESA